MRKPLLSIGIIFRNDIRCLERCLKSLTNLRNAIPCQLVMADTGSSDGSRDIAAQYADLLFDFPWINDFAAARNAVMDRCTGAWYLSIDTDELLEDETELVTFLKSKNKNPAAAGALVIQRNYTSSEMNGDYIDGLAGRLLRMDTGLRFAGSIHEIWPLQENGYSLTVFYHTVLKHDGYVYAKEEDAQSKAWRNLKLLEPLLEKEPQNCHRLLQCMESAAAIPKVRMQYARLGMELVEQDLPEMKKWGGVICRQAVENANREGHTEDRDHWMKEGIRRFPENPYVQIDLNYYHMTVSYQTKDFMKALSYAGAYRQAIDRYDRQEYPTVLLMLSPLYMTTDTCRMWGILYQADCLCELERWEEAGKALMEPDLEQQTQEQLTFWMRSLRRFYQSGNEVTAQVKKLEPLLNGDFSADQKKRDLQRKAQQIAASFFFAPKNEDEDQSLAYGMFRSLTSSDLGRAARLMDTTDGKEALRIAEDVTQWAAFPVPAMARVIALGNPFPSAFYQLSGETLRAIAAGMTNTSENVPKMVLSWKYCDDFQNSMVKFQFLFDLTIAALRVENWKNGEERMLLYNQFLDLAADYLPNYYNPILLQDETEWGMLPNLHHFALLLLQARELENIGNSIGYIQHLRKALRVSPAMKDMVDYLLEHKPKTAAQRQLEQLAEQVRAVLAQYAPDDPVVAQLKQSEAYQRVAALLEQQDGSEAAFQTKELSESPASLRKS